MIIYECCETTIEGTRVVRTFRDSRESRALRRLVHGWMLENRPREVLGRSWTRTDTEEKP